MSLSKRAYFINLGGIIIFTGFALWLIISLFRDGLYPLASTLSAIFVFLILVYLRPRFNPMRWLAIGMAISMLFTLYPILYTLYLSVTNMGSGHLMSKPQAISRLEKAVYMPEDGKSYRWVGYQADEGDFALWLMPD
ncbi:MAG: hypothetical protein K8I82_21000, partial [Anaerolineae bacterium]|nr:hypothetical protein [Anaerolineae bacterium]